MFDTYNAEGFAEFSAGGGLNNDVTNKTDELIENKVNLATDKFVEVAMLKGELFGAVAGAGVVLKMESESKSGEFAVFKPSDRQDNYHKSWGTEITIPAESKQRREVAAYIVSEEMGFNLVPETVYRNDIENGGSLQKWVDGKNGEELSLEEIPKSVLIKIAVFNHIIGAIDGHKRNLIQTPDNKIALIDNGISFPNMEIGFYSNCEITENVQNNPIPEELLETIGVFVDSAGLPTERGGILRDKLSPYISETEVKAMFMRMKNLLSNKRTPDPYEKPPQKNYFE